MDLQCCNIVLSMPCCRRSWSSLENRQCSAFACHFFYMFFWGFFVVIWFGGVFFLWGFFFCVDFLVLFFTALKKIQSKIWFVRQRSSVWGRDQECWKKCCSNSVVMSVMPGPCHCMRRSVELDICILFCHRYLNLLDLIWMLLCGTLCLLYVHMCTCAGESKTWGQGGISQPTFSAKSHF